VRTLGEIGDKDTENEVLLLEHDIPHAQFSQDVLSCLPQMPWSITDEASARCALTWAEPRSAYPAHGWGINRCFCPSVSPMPLLVHINDHCYYGTLIGSPLTLSHPPSSRLPLLSTRPAVICPAEDHHRQLIFTKLYCLVTEAHGCEQLAQGSYSTAGGRGSNLRPPSHQSDTLATRLLSHPVSSHAVF